MIGKILEKRAVKNNKLESEDRYSVKYNYRCKDSL